MRKKYIPYEKKFQFDQHLKTTGHTPKENTKSKQLKVQTLLTNLSFTDEGRKNFRERK